MVVGVSGGPNAGAMAAIGAGSLALAVAPVLGCTSPVAPLAMNELMLKLKNTAKRSSELEHTIIDLVPQIVHIVESEVRDHLPVVDLRS